MKICIEDSKSENHKYDTRHLILAESKDSDEIILEISESCYDSAHSSYDNNGIKITIKKEELVKALKSFV